ncbi:MAG: hypothetical protein AAF664_26150, partial [Planctomycetota bacterium]
MSLDAQCESESPVKADSPDRRFIRPRAGQFGESSVLAWTFAALFSIVFAKGFQPGLDLENYSLRAEATQTADVMLLPARDVSPGGVPVFHSFARPGLLIALDQELTFRLASPTA